MKVCNICNEKKDFNLFYCNKLSKEGYFKYCKKCHLKKTTLRQNKIVENKNENLFFLNGEFFSEHLETGLLVSNLGRVFKPYSEKGNKRYSHFMKQTLMNNGYYSVSFCSKHINVHRLVCETFIENKKKFTHINHIDGNKINNNLKNLEWCTHLQNINHAVNMDSYKVKLNRLQVLKIRDLHGRRTVKELAFRYSVSETNIRLILNRKIWKHI